MPTARLLAWCGPGLPVAALGLPLVVYLPPHYAGTLGLPLGVVGLLFALVRLVDIPIDPLLGHAMDRTRSRFGRFRPWVAGGGVVMAAGVWLLFMAGPGVTATATFFALLTLYLGFSALNLAQLGWGSRLSGDYAERARIFGWWTMTNVAGTMSVLFIPPLVARIAPDAGATAAVHAVGWFILLMIPLVVLAAVLWVPEGEGPGEDHGIRWADLRALLADRRMLRLLGVDLLLAVAGGVSGALFLFFFTAARGTSPEVASLLLLFYFVAGLLAAPLWIRLAARRGKHVATAVAAAWLGLAVLGLLVVPPEPFWVPALAMAAAGVPFAAPNFLLRAMMADLIDAQRLDRREAGGAASDSAGLNYALLVATAKLGYALPVGLTYPLLAWMGFDPAPGAANTPAAIRGLELLFIGPPLLLGLAAAWLVWRWPLTADAHAAVRARLASGG